MELLRTGLARKSITLQLTNFGGCVRSSYPDVGCGMQKMADGGETDDCIENVEKRGHGSDTTKLRPDKNSERDVSVGT